MASFTVCLEGNIGSGKSSFLKRFKNLPTVLCIDEPVEAWRNVDNHNLLDMFYTDPHKKAYLFQHYAQITMLQLHNLKTGHDYKIMERSVYSTQVFAKILNKAGMLSNVEHTVLSQWNQISEAPVNLFIYLRSTPEVVFERIKKRNRVEESSITLEYLKQVHQGHEDWMQNLIESGTYVLILDADQSLDEMVKEFLFYTTFI
ncbi:putative deoxynucleoside kinase [Diachasmimorpha longicaudata entomopoxvirus]|uniref:Putative deoxynucleoside kinase n=1 Tax=Diachasmimorpha longicaudata entomopoxvirus TaxID=109981 RepID=A0A7R5WMC1_9POXV|nr:putative deoxynucleoside kinase [Diachasmimorpha longicaudata entomopoxvirus]AKS26469.1 putative deoxynucleoside kinase [Diachasmimorpha longicaudata entomopoxvirus]